MSGKKASALRDALMEAWLYLQTPDTDDADLMGQESALAADLVACVLDEGQEIDSLLKSLSPQWLLERLGNDRLWLKLAFACIVRQKIYPKMVIRAIMDILRKQTLEQAVQALYAISFLKNPGADDVEKVYRLSFSHPDGADPFHGYSWRLVRGVWLNQDKISRLIAGLSRNWRMERLGRLEKIILGMAFYEFICGWSAPQAIIDNSLDLAATFGAEDALTFIKGILSAFIKDSRHKMDDFICD